MQLLLDTHILLACIERRLQNLPRPISAAIEQPENSVLVSVVSLWEVAIKWRLGKLPIAIDLKRWPEALRLMGFALLPIHSSHVIAEIGPEPRNKDPFDRLLLGICAAEDSKLVTIDRALADHPLAWRETP